MTRKSTDANRREFSADWEELTRQGEAPEMGGRSAEEARRNEQRRQKVRPTERRRRKRRISVTVDESLVERLREIGKEHGYVSEQGEGQVASPIVARFLRLAIEAYETGLIEQYEEDVTTTVEEFRWKA